MMNNYGSGVNGQWTFLDMLSLCSFMISLINLNENFTQSDKQDLQSDLSEQTEVLLREIHSHLKEQDKKLDFLLKEITK